MTTSFESRLQQLAETTRLSAAKIAEVLRGEGHTCALSTVGRKVSAWRSRPTHPKRTKVSRSQRALAPAPAAAPPASARAATRTKPAAAPARGHDDPRAELAAAVQAAETPEEYIATQWALLLHDEPTIAAYLDGGAGRVDALSSAGYDEMLLLNRPADLAELARYVTDDVVTWGRDEDAGETTEQYAAWQSAQRAAARARAVALLEGALALVREGKS